MLLPILLVERSFSVSPKLREQDYRFHPFAIRVRKDLSVRQEPAAMGVGLPALCSGASWQHLRAHAGSVREHPGKTNRHRAMAGSTGKRCCPNRTVVTPHASFRPATRFSMPPAARPTTPRLDIGYLRRPLRHRTSRPFNRPSEPQATADAGLRARVGSPPAA